MSKWIVELEPGVWIGRVRGMNQPVQEKGLSRPYSRKQDAEVGITWMYKKGYPVSHARIVEVEEVEG
jgi:hypothetical protein